MKSWTEVALSKGYLACYGRGCLWVRWWLGGGRDCSEVVYPSVCNFLPPSHKQPVALQHSLRANHQMVDVANIQWGCSCIWFRGLRNRNLAPFWRWCLSPTFSFRSTRADSWNMSTAAQGGGIHKSNLGSQPLTLFQIAGHALPLTKAKRMPWISLKKKKKKNKTKLPQLQPRGRCRRPKDAL